jgi:Protein of unknown function (DUF3828)
MMLLALLVAATQPAETPKAYMERLYASYRNPDFNPLDHPDRYFTARLVTAMNEDARLAKGEVGYVDGDPICQCQDPDGLQARVVRVTRQGDAKAVAEVIIDFTDSTLRRVRFSLVRTAAGWRIADVSSGDEPSFLRAIEQSNRKARSKH